MKEIDETILEAAGHLAAFGQLILNDGWGDEELNELEENILSAEYIDIASSFLEFISKAGIEREG